MSLIEIRDLTVGYDLADGGFAPAVEDVTIDIESGEFIGLVGESGSGKSTLGFALTRLLREPGRILHGQIVFDGQDIAGLDPETIRKQRQGGFAMVLQSGMNALNPVRSIRHHFDDIFKAHGHVPRERFTERTKELLGKVRLPEDVLDRYPGELSGGMRQRVSIALALSLEPRLMVFDEPTTALDVLVQHAVMGTIRELQATEGFTAMLISHDLGIVLEDANRVLVMHEGRIVEDAPSQQILGDPKADYTQMLLSHYADPRAEHVSLPGLGRDAGPASVQRAGRTAHESIVVEGVSKIYPPPRRGEQPVTAVDDVSFTLEPGAALALVGASGSGKSTIAKLITGVERPTSGTITFGDLDVGTLRGGATRRLHRDVQMVFQDPYAALNPLHRSSTALARPVMNFGGLRGNAVRDRVIELLETVGLTPGAEFAPKLPHQLSGGQRQRVVIARALAGEPQVIVADEPVSMLDVSLRAGVLKLLRGPAQRLGCEHALHHPRPAERAPHHRPDHRARARSHRRARRDGRRPAAPRGRVHDGAARRDARSVDEARDVTGASGGQFPDGFLWGAATAAHQVEGNNINSDWWVKEHTPGTSIVEPSGDAADSYHRYREDMQLLADAGLNAYRFSIEWSRIEPERGVVSRAEIDHYRRMVDTCLEVGLEPVVTLMHFTVPRWFQRRRASGSRAMPPNGSDDSWMPPCRSSRAACATSAPSTNPTSPPCSPGTDDPANLIACGLPNPDLHVADALLASHQEATARLEALPEIQSGWTVATQAFEASTEPGSDERLVEYGAPRDDWYLEAARDDDFVGVQAYTRTIIGPEGPLPIAEGVERTLTGWEFFPDALERGIRAAAELRSGCRCSCARTASRPRTTPAASPTRRARSRASPARSPTASTCAATCTGARSTTTSGRAGTVRPSGSSPSIARRSCAHRNRAWRGSVRSRARTRCPTELRRPAAEECDQQQRDRDHGQHDLDGRRHLGLGRGARLGEDRDHRCDRQHAGGDGEPRPPRAPQEREHRAHHGEHRHDDDRDADLDRHRSAHVGQRTCDIGDGEQCGEHGADPEQDPRLRCCRCGRRCGGGLARGHGRIPSWAGLSGNDPSLPVRPISDHRAVTDHRFSASTVFAPTAAMR